MQVVRAAAGAQVVLATVEREARVANPVREPADDRAKTPAVGNVGIERIEAERDVDRAAAPVGQLDRRDRGSIVDGAHAQAGAAGQRPDEDGRAVGQRSETFTRHEAAV